MLFREVNVTSRSLSPLSLSHPPRVLPHLRPPGPHQQPAPPHRVLRGARHLRRGRLRHLRLPLHHKLLQRRQRLRRLPARAQTRACADHPQPAAPEAHATTEHTDTVKAAATAGPIPDRLLAESGHGKSAKAGAAVKAASAASAASQSVGQGTAQAETAE